MNLGQWFINFLIRISLPVVMSGVKSGIIPNQELAEELHKPTVRKFEVLILPTWN